MSEYRDQKTAAGERFQDEVVEWLLRTRGIVIMQFTSREYQVKRGESLSGVEIKFDEKVAATGNLWIEVGEKAQPRAGDYFPSGILRADNSWLYVIGDYNTLFVFAKRSLQLLHESNRYSVIENNMKTSIGFLLPTTVAERWAAFVERRKKEPALRVGGSTDGGVQTLPPEKLIASGEMLNSDEIHW